MGSGKSWDDVKLHICVCALLQATESGLVRNYQDLRTGGISETG